MSGFDIFMIVLACLLILVGFVGCIMPGLPGTPLCWGALLCRHFMNGGDVIISWKTLIITGVITILFRQFLQRKQVVQNWEHGAQLLV